jgi:hypothetical protein
MLPIQAVHGSTSKHAFSADGGRTMTSTHYLARAGKDNFMSVLVEPGTGNIYVVGDRYTQPNQDTNTPGGAANFHTSQRAIIIKFDKLGNILWLRELSKDGAKDDPTDPLGTKSNSGPQTWHRNDRFWDLCLNPLTHDIFVVGHTTSMEYDYYNWASPRSPDCLVAKYNSSGTLQWQKFYGRDLYEWLSLGGGWWYYSDDKFNHCAPFTDGRFAAAGNTSNNGGPGVGSINNNVMLTVWNDNGSVSWTKWLSINSSQNNTTSNVGSTHIDGLDVDGNNNVYILVGSHLVKFNSSGSVQWKKSWTSNIGYISSLVVSKNGDVYIGAYSGSYGSYVPGMMKFNSSGTIQWTKTFTGANFSGGQIFVDEEENVWLGDGGSQVCVDSNGNVVRAVSVDTNSAGGYFRGFTVNEGYMTVLSSSIKIGRNQSNGREMNLGLFQFEVSGANNGSFTHTNTDNTTNTVTVSTPSMSASNQSNPSISNSSISVIDYPGNNNLRFNNGSCTNFTNSSIYYNRTLTV